MLFPSFKACSFDKGFHSPANQAGLNALLGQVTLPKKGKWSASDEAREASEPFVAARKEHPAVESGINALEVHGLDICRDRGIDGCKRYISPGRGVAEHPKDRPDPARCRTRAPDPWAGTDTTAPAKTRSLTFLTVFLSATDKLRLKFAPFANGRKRRIF